METETEPKPLKPLKPINCDGCGKSITNVRTAMLYYDSRAQKIGVRHKITCDPHHTDDVWQELHELDRTMPYLIPKYDAE